MTVAVRNALSAATRRQIQVLRTVYTCIIADLTCDSKERMPPAGIRGRSTGLSHWSGSNPLLRKKIPPSRWDSGILWSRIRESNPPSRLGKPLYYRYTNPAYFVRLQLTGAIIADPNGKFNHNLSTGCKYFSARPLQKEEPL